jgi:hypothetical protein
MSTNRNLKVVLFPQDYATTRHKSTVEEVALHWNSPEVESWKVEAEEMQQSLYEMLGGDQMKPGLYSSQNRTDLERKVAYAMYGPPSQLPNARLNAGTGYKKKQLKIVRKICDAILKQTGQAETSMSFLFTCIKIHDSHLAIPVFRIAAETESDVGENGANYFYVDADQRVYRGWEDYLKNNRLPRCFMCYPQNGIYTTTESKVDVDFGESPACSLSVRVLNAADITASLIATVLGITALAVPVSAPVFIVTTVWGLASGVFGLGRSARTLVDRRRHGQTLGVHSGEARNSWIGVVGNTVGMALGGVSMVASKIFHGTTRLVGLNVGVTSLSIGATALKGLTILDHFTNVGKKLVEEEEVTPLDAFQMATSVFFFTGSVVSTQTAFGALLNLKAAGVDLKMAEVLQVVRSRSALSAAVIGATNTLMDGEDIIEEPEMLWPKDDDRYWKCSIL